MLRRANLRHSFLAISIICFLVVVGLVHYAFAGMETDGVTVWPIAGGSGATVSILPSGVSPGAIFDKDGSTGTAGKYLSKSATGLYWDTPAGGSGGSGATTFMPDSGVKATAGTVAEGSGIFIVGQQGMSTASEGVGGNTVYVSASGVQSQVSAYALASASVTPLMVQHTTPYVLWSSVTPITTQAVSPYALNTKVDAAGAPETTTGASLWAGATPYIVEASGIGSVTNWITSATSAFGTGSGTTTSGVTVYGSDGSAVSGASNVWLALVSGSSSTVVSDGKGGATLYYGVSGASSYFPTLNSSAFSATGGKLGIGTGSPSVRVHIYDNTVNPIIIQSTSGAGGDGGCYIKFQDGNGDVAYYGIEEASGGNAFFQHDAGKTLRIETLGGGLGSLTTGSLVDVASSTGSVGQFLGRSSSGLKWSGPSGLTVYGSGGSVVSGASNMWLQLVSGTSTTVVSDGKGGATLYYGTSGTSVYNLALNTPTLQSDGSGVTLSGSPSGLTTFVIDSSGITAYGKTVIVGKLLVGDAGQNIFIGSKSIMSGSSEAMTSAGIYNIALGQGALSQVTSSRYQIAIGPFALQKFHDLTAGGDRYNIAVGFGAGANLTNNSRDNILIGPYALFTATDESSKNVVIGYGAGTDLVSATTSNNNVFIGYGAGSNVTTGSSNFALGYNTQLPNPAGDNQLNIGNLIYGAGGGVSIYNLTLYGGTTVFGLNGSSTFQVDNTGGHADTPILATNVANMAYVLAQISAGTSTFGAGGAGATTFQTSDGTEAEAALLGDAASGIFIIGAQGIESTASGNTIFVKADSVHSQASKYVTDHTEKSAFANSPGGVTDFAVNSEVSAVFRVNLAKSAFANSTGGVTDFSVNSSVSEMFRTYLAAAAFTGATKFATNAELTAHTTILTGVSGEATHANLRTYTAAAAFTGTTKFATNTELTNHTTTLSGVSGEATHANLRTYTAAASFSGATKFASNTELTNHTTTLTGVSGEATKASLTAHTVTLTGVSGEATKAWLTAHTNDAAFAGNTNFATNAELTVHTNTLSGASGEATHANLRTYTAPGAVAAVSMYAVPLVTNATGTTPYIQEAARSGVTGLSGVSKQVEWTLLYPDYNGELSSVTPIKIFTVSHIMYPNGIAMTDMVAEVVSGNTTYTIIYKKWPARDVTNAVEIGNMPCVSGSSRFSSGLTIIPPGGRVFVHPSTTVGAHQIGGYFIFYPR